MNSFKLSSCLAHRLKNAIRKTQDASELRRAQALLSVHGGGSISDAARFVGVSTRSIYRWMEDAEAEMKIGRTKLKGDPGGRPPKWSEETEELLEILFSYSPDQLGYVSTSWTVSLLRQHLHRWLGESFSARTIQRHLHQIGYVWKRSRYVLEPDPKRSQKMANIRGKIANLDKKSTVLFEDETDLVLFPPLRSTWVKRGTDASVPITGWNDKRVIFGVINIKTGSCLFLIREHSRAEDFQVFLRALKWHYRSGQILIILDSAPNHTALSSQSLARTLGVELVWLPLRSPELNPLDTLWGKAKNMLSANLQYEDIDHQAELFAEYLNNLSQSDILQKVGANHETFWLWKN